MSKCLVALERAPVGPGNSELLMQPRRNPPLEKLQQRRERLTPFRPRADLPVHRLAYSRAWLELADIPIADQPGHQPQHRVSELGQIREQIRASRLHFIRRL